MKKKNFNEIINVTKEKAKTISDWCWKHKVEIGCGVIVIVAETTVVIVCKKGKLKDNDLKLANDEIKKLKSLCHDKDVIIGMQKATIKMKDELIDKKDSAYLNIIANGTREGSSTCASELAFRKSYLKKKCNISLN